MLRLLTSLILLICIAAGAMYVAYGTVEPCRALAVERARRAQNATGVALGAAIAPLTRVETGNLTTSQCASDLLDSWGERLSNLRY